MPTTNETKTFEAGIQNRDNDPRVIPPGEYVRLINGRISRSEADGVGSIENTLGNEGVADFVDNTAVVLGSIREQGTDAIYYFIKGSEEDAVYEYTPNPPEGQAASRPLLRDNVGILNFNIDYLITGINIIGEGDNRLLLWTDGFNPPRKVNISRAFSRLQSGLNGFTEQEISVEKNPPLYPPIVTAVRIGDIADREERELLENEDNLKEKFVRFAYRWKYEDNEYSAFSPFSQPGFVPDTFSFDTDTGIITGMENQIKALDVSFDTGTREVVEVDLLYKEDGRNIVYVVETFNKSDREWNNNVVLGEIVENIFLGTGETVFQLPDVLRDTEPILLDGEGVEMGVTRGAGETFTIVPASDYTLQRGELENDDTITLDNPLLENESLIVRYFNNAEPIRFSSNKLYRALPEDQLTRVFDNVPIRAKTQEIIQNRIVYGNYADRYNLEDVLKTYGPVEDAEGNTTTALISTRREEIVVDMKARLSAPTIEDDFIVGGIGARTLKSDRNYEVGVVYLDNLGRQTPVLTSEENTVTIPISNANKVNRLSVDMISKAPEWAVAYRYFVKQNRGQHFNIIPLELQVQRDDNRFVWIRLSDADREKVSEGDYLSLKSNMAQFAYPDGGEKISVRVEEVGPQGRNFLEATPPVRGKIVSEGTAINEAGEVISEGVVYTVQEAGIWMRVKNLSTFNQQHDTTVTAEAISYARSNNAARSNFQPIRSNQRGVPLGGGAVTSSIENYIDARHHYASGTADTSLNTSAEDVDFGGIYNPGEVRADGLETGPSGSQQAGASPMRLDIEIEAGSGINPNRFTYAWYLSPSHDNPAVVRQKASGSIVIPDGTPEIVAPDGEVTTAFVPAPAIVLVNGAEITFNRPPEEYNPGDRFTVIYRRASNFMWRCWNVNEKDSGGGPNGTNNRGFDSRRAHLMFTGEGIFKNGINGMSKIQIGVVDGKGSSIDGVPIVLPFKSNELDATQNVFYSNIEELIFEEGYWSGTSSPSFMGTSRETGSLFGIHQMGFWRGIADEASDSVFSPRTTANYWRLNSGPRSVIVGLPGEDESNAQELHGFIQSGVRNDGSGFYSRNTDLRMTGTVTFVQGQGVNADNISTLDVAFETFPDELVSDIYYETGQTFPCLNGIHFGNEMSNHQRISQVVGIDAAGNETQETIGVVPVDLDYFNCYAWSNGIESCVIRDEFSGNKLDPGAKASIVVDEYEQRENFSNLIFSAPFNQATNTNGLNEFSSSATAFGTIIKEMDEQDGSVQHMYSRDTDLVVFQEDKISKVLSDKNALFGADGQVLLTSQRPVLGQIIPFAGEFGMSKDPESFAVYGNRMYCTDRNRGAVLRIGGSGIEEISNAGMRDFFRDELDHDYGDGRKPLAIGSYDDYHDQYILSTREALQDPVILASSMLPLNISRQAFLSRTDACRFPREDLQFIEVYEFYTSDEPAGFQVGDLIYTDEDRTSIFLGDNNWFVWTTSESDIDLATTTVTTDRVQTFSYTDDHVNSPEPGQSVTVSSRGTNPTDYVGTVVSYNRVGDGNGSDISIRYDEGVVQLAGQDQIAVNYEIRVDYEFVINIDNFGFVRAKRDCTGITAPNHDAVRVSLYSYTTAREACGRGLVARIVYHNGDDATPDEGDSIYDTPYASDEYIQGCYMKGRTQKNGWYQMFDGRDFEDYVILILQGKVVRKLRCAAVMANRRRILTSENPLQRRENEREDRLATRVCSMLPTMERWFDGDGEFPIAGDIMYEDNFNDNTPLAGYYAIEGGSYALVTSTGVISFISICSITICIDDVVRSKVLDMQNQDDNNWTFLGVNGLLGDLPVVDAVSPMVGVGNNTLFNGNITSLGDFETVSYSWFYQIDGVEPTERELYNNGIQVGVEDRSFAGPVDDFLTTGLPPFATVWTIFTARVEDTTVTTQVLEATTIRLVLPDAPGAITNSGIDRVPLGGTRTLTASINAGNDPLDTFTSQWCLDGVDIGGATNQFLVVTADATSFGEYTYKQVFRGLTLSSPGLTLTEAMPPTFFVLNAFTPGELTSTLSTDSVASTDHPGGPFTHSWYNLTAPTVVLSTATTLAITADGTYGVDVGDPDGITRTTNTIVDLNAAVSVTFSGPPSALPTEAITLALAASDADGNINSYIITKDGAEIYNNAASPGATFGATGYGTYVLTVSDDRAHSATETITVANASIPGTSGFGSESLTGTSGNVALSPVEINTSGFSPAYANNTSSFTQTQTFQQRTDRTPTISSFSATCNVVTVSFTGDSSQANCASPNTAFGGTNIVRTSSASNASSTSGTLSRTRTITVTGTAETSTEAAQGDQDGDGDTLDSLSRTTYTTSPNVGGFSTPWVVTTNVAPSVTLSVSSSGVSLSGSTSGSTATGAVGTAWSFSVSATPTATNQWTGGGTETRTFNASGSFANVASATASITTDSTESALLPFSATCSVNGGTTGDAVTFSTNLVGATVSPSTLSVGSNSYTVTGNIPTGFAGQGTSTSCVSSATGTTPIACFTYDVIADGGGSARFSFTRCGGGTGNIFVPDGDAAETPCVQQGSVSSDNGGRIQQNSSC